MSKSQEACRPSTIKNSDEKKVELTLVSNSLPDIGDLDSILEESERVIAEATLSEESVNDMVEQLKVLLERLKNAETVREQRLRRVLAFDPLKDLTSADYEGLVAAGLVDFAGAEKLKKLDDVIIRMESLDCPTDDSIAELGRLTLLKGSFQKRLENQIEKMKQKIFVRRAEVKNKVLEHYSKKTEVLEGAIAKIEANPRVVERFNAIAEQEKKDFEEKIEKFLLETSQLTSLVSKSHSKIFERLSEVTGDENIGQDLFKAHMEEYGRKQDGIFESARNRLIASIIDGEGEQQLQEPKEVVPWAMRSTTISYIEALNSLRYRRNREALKAVADSGNEDADRLYQECRQILNENEVLRKLVGSKNITDSKTGKKSLGPFWAAFNIRRENDKNGTTEARKKKRDEAEKLEAQAQKNVSDIIGRGGFSVEIPILKFIQGRQQVVGKKYGAVRLERVQSKKGKELWKVKEVSSAVTGLEVESTSLLNMSSFPSWLKECAEKKFIKHGEDFDELLAYEPEE